MVPLFNQTRTGIANRKFHEIRDYLQLRRGVAEHCVLGLLREGERYGFDLARALADRGLVASEGTIYPLLSRLRKEGLVSTTWRQSEVGPPRRYYALTPGGLEALQQFQRQWRAFRNAVDETLGSEKES